MAREGIYAGDKEVVQRYIGSRLVWEQKLTEVAHFENFTDWKPYGDRAIKRTFQLTKGHNDTRQPNFDYDATRAKVNGKLYDIYEAHLSVEEYSFVYLYNFIITFKNKADRDDVSGIYQKDIYLYKKG